MQWGTENVSPYGPSSLAADVTHNDDHQVMGMNKDREGNTASLSSQRVSWSLCLTATYTDLYIYYSIAASIHIYLAVLFASTV